ncbi:hypothetical protein [Tenuifilum thalassicum]|uniref:Lipocalin family protein n=1 Tax=Tenuifilum thalassicum TaxID=2590900 RepID=A0A7D4AYV8_9BACT|nr:hypothetical protein [Tenuifilum thalassicum]QKG81054.1 hypothetical protein FHG85_12520 [Tenuifilum thalassicum]
MKTAAIKYLMLTVFLFSLSCSEDITTLAEIKEKLIGEWEWVQSEGGLSGTEVLTPETTGIYRYIKFNEKDTVLVWENNENVQTTSYCLQREESILKNRESIILTINYKYFNNNDTIILPMRYIIVKIGRTLILEEDVYDGYKHWYTRL